MSLRYDNSTFTRSCVKSACFSEGRDCRFQRKAVSGSVPLLLPLAALRIGLGRIS